jgi:predicted amidohydrolase
MTARGLLSCLGMLMRPLLAFVLLLHGCGDDLAFGPSDTWGAGVPYDDSQASVRLSVAAVSLLPTRVPEENVAAIESWVDDIVEARPEVRVVAFGETILGHYFDADDPEGYQRSVAEPIPGPATDHLGVVARRHGLYLAFGMAEVTVPGGVLFNSYVLLDPEGEIHAVHRKANLVWQDEASGFVPGEGPTLTDIDGIRTVLLICADANSRTVVADAASLRPRIVLQGFASGLVDLDLRYDPFARSLGAWLVFANRWGREGQQSYSGFIYVADPAGGYRDRRSGGEGVVFADMGVDP